MSFVDGMRLGIGTLTVIPVPPPKTINRDSARIAMVGAPVAVLPIVGAAVLVGAALSSLYFSALTVGLITVGLLQLGTRAMHADGLADTIDGLGASWDRERALEIMRTGDVGPMGVVALILVLGLQAECLGFLLQTWETTVLALVCLAGSRVALTLGCRVGVPSARPNGLGEAVAGVVPTWVALVSWTALGLVFSWLYGQWWLGLLLVFLVAVLVLAFLQHVISRIGGITGDVLGALIELAATLLLLIACLSFW